MTENHALVCQPIVCCLYHHATAVQTEIRNAFRLPNSFLHNLQNEARFLLLLAPLWTRCKYRPIIDQRRLISWLQTSNLRDSRLLSHRIASSKTLFRFLCVKAEHSRYFWAFISFATCTACSYWIGAIFFCLKFCRVASSSLRSSFVPTRMIGTPGAWCSISGCH